MDRRSPRRKDRRHEPPRTRHHVHGHAAVGAPRGTVLTRPSSFLHARSIAPQTGRAIMVETSPRRISMLDRKSTRLNSSHDQISYAVFCLKKKKKKKTTKVYEQQKDEMLLQ